MRGMKISSAPSHVSENLNTNAPETVRQNASETVQPNKQNKDTKKPYEQEQQIRLKEEATRPTTRQREVFVRRVGVVASAGLQADSVLLRKTCHLKEHYNLGPEIGNGQYGTTFHCLEKATGKNYACKSIPKVKLLTRDDVKDVRKEIQIMHHLAGTSPNLISIKGAYEDAVAVHLVMELCEGGELFDRIIEKGHYAERKAAKLARTIVSVVENCHSLGVMHRDLKPENFLFVDGHEDSTLKAIDFGMSVFFKPGLDKRKLFNFFLVLAK